MLIIDTTVETRLLSRLEAIQNEETISYCIRMACSELPPPQPTREWLIDYIGQVSTDVDISAYFCQDGDVYLLTRGVGYKTLRPLVAALTAILPEALIEMYETSFLVTPLLIQIEKKLANIQANKTAEMQRARDVENQQRRERILHAEVVADAAARVERKRSQREKPEIMIIEDDVFSRRLVENLLPKDYGTTSLGSAEGAIEKYVQLAPNLLFLDINLPDVSGHELLEKILAIDSHAYIVMLSGNCDRDNVLRAMQNGASGFVAKPFNREKIYHYIERCPSFTA